MHLELILALADRETCFFRRQLAARRLYLLHQQLNEHFVMHALQQQLPLVLDLLESFRGAQRAHERLKHILAALVVEKHAERDAKLVALLLADALDLNHELVHFLLHVHRVVLQLHCEGVGFGTETEMSIGGRYPVTSRNGILIYRCCCLFCHGVVKCVT